VGANDSAVGKQASNNKAFIIVRFSFLRSLRSGWISLWREKQQRERRGKEERGGEKRPFELYGRNSIENPACTPRSISPRHFLQ
jgi:hypothetical protein